MPDSQSGRPPSYLPNWVSSYWPLQAECFICGVLALLSLRRDCLRNESVLHFATTKKIITRHPSPVRHHQNFLSGMLATDYLKLRSDSGPRRHCRLLPLWRNAKHVQTVINTNSQACFLKSLLSCALAPVLPATADVHSSTARMLVAGGCFGDGVRHGGAAGRGGAVVARGVVTCLLVNKELLQDVHGGPLTTLLDQMHR